MRRLTAYVTMSCAILLAAGVSFVPSMSKMNSDLDYGSAHEVVYNLTNKDDGAFIDTDQYITDIADTMKDRLDTYNIDSYSVVVEGNDSIRVKFAAESDTEYENVRDYLAFSGKDFSMATKEEESRRDYNTLFKDETARIEYVNSIPYVVIPVSDVAAMKSLIETAQDAGDDDDSEATQEARYHGVRRADSESDDSSSADLFLWANWEEGDDYEKAEADSEVTGKKIIAAFNSSNIWYKEELDDDEDPYEIQYVCGYADDDGNYDASKLEEANDMAVRLRNLFNASEYDVNVKVTYEKDIDAVVDTLVSPGTVNTSVTLIATAVAYAIMLLLLIVFYRLGSVGIFTNNIVVTFLTLFFFLLLGTTMNISALVGIILVTLSNLATSIFYMSKLKENVYKGYTLKKANQETLKKYTLFTVDVSVVLLFAGLMLFLLGGNILKSMGVALFFGGILTLLSNETVFRMLANFLCNEGRIQDKINLLNFDKSKIVNPIAAEENSGEAAPEAEEKKPAKKAHYTKNAKIVSIIGAAAVLVGAVMSVIFGVKNKTIINTNALTKDSTEVYLVLEYDDSAIITIKNEDTFKELVLGNIKRNGEALTYSDVEYGTRSDTDYETTVKTTYDYYVTTFAYTFSNDDKFTYTYDGTDYEVYSIEEAIYGLSELNDPYVDTTDYLDYATKVSHETVINEPNFGWVSLACAISIVGAGLYFALRYRPSKAIATTLVTLGTSFLSIALFVITRLSATPVVYVVIPATMIVTLIASIFYMNKEKAMLSEIRTADLTAEKRHEVMMEATEQAAAPLFIYAIIAVYFGINYFGFGPSAYAKLFAGIVVGTILAVLFIVTCLGPISEFFAKRFAKVAEKRAAAKKDKPKKQQKIKLQEKPKTSEPEETIFIGIND